MIGCMIETSVLISAAAHLAELTDHLDIDGNLLITNDPYLGVNGKKRNHFVCAGAGKVWIARGGKKIIIKSGCSHAADPLAVVPDGFERGQVAAVEDVSGGGDELALLEVVLGVAGADGHELHHAGIAIAVNHAAGAAVADEFGIVELVDVAHGRFPGVAAVEVEVPVEVKIFVAAEAAEFLRLPAQMPLHFVERFGRD